jgi:hypothetical protein
LHELSNNPREKKAGDRGENAVRSNWNRTVIVIVIAIIIVLHYNTNTTWVAKALHKLTVVVVVRHCNVFY